VSQLKLDTFLVRIVHLPEQLRLTSSEIRRARRGTLHFSTFLQYSSNCLAIVVPPIVSFAVATVRQPSLYTVDFNSDPPHGWSRDEEVQIKSSLKIQIFWDVTPCFWASS